MRVQPSRLGTSGVRFTVEEANRRLPLVRSIVQDLIGQFRDLESLRDRIHHIEGELSAAGAEVQGDLRLLREELSDREKRLAETHRELDDLGVILKDTHGQCHFPAQSGDGRDIALSWQPGEPKILYWHDLESGSAGRQLLNPQT